MRILHGTEERQSDSGCGHKNLLKLNIEHCKIIKCVVLCDLQLVKECA